jgi:phenylacetate-CoA ligase
MTSLVPLDSPATSRSAGELAEPGATTAAARRGDRLRSLYAMAYGSILFPAWQGVVHRRAIGAQRRLLARTQWMSRDERDARQLQELRALLLHAGSQVPYWRELFHTIGFDPRQVRRATDLAALPVLTREIVQERLGDLIDPAHRGKNISKGTSGTSGVPLRFEHCNESEAWRQAVRLRGYGWAGYRIGMPTLHYWGAGAVIPDGLAGRKIRLDRALRREVYVDAVRQDDASMHETALLVTRMRPHAIIAYTQALALFARWVNEHGRRDWPDIRVLCCAEGLMSRDRDAIERAFGPAVYETYGSRETMLIASECDAHTGMHLSEENVVVEIARDGRPVPAGVAGDVLVTDLHNYGMPFIRYVNGDVAAMAEDAVCPCGRTLRKLSRVEGRRMETLRDGNGDPVPGMLFASLLQLDAGALRAFQVVQKKSGEVELKVVRGREWNEERFKAASRRLKSYFKGLPFKVTFCDDIPASKSGKRRPIIVETGGN